MADDLISKIRPQRPRGRGPTSGGASPVPPRRHFDIRAAAAPYHRRRGFFEAQAHAGYAPPPVRAALDTPTRLYISNLDYTVSNDDIELLFSDVGHLMSYSINYDRRGRSKGTAEILFSTRSGALAALKKYNNVPLDGKRMKIEIIGTNLEAPQPPVGAFAFNPPAVPSKRGHGSGGAGGRPRVEVDSVGMDGGGEVMAVSKFLLKIRTRISISTTLQQCKPAK